MVKKPAIRDVARFPDDKILKPLHSTRPLNVRLRQVAGRIISAELSTHSIYRYGVFVGAANADLEDCPSNLRRG